MTKAILSAKSGSPSGLLYCYTRIIGFLPSWVKNSLRASTDGERTARKFTPLQLDALLGWYAPIEGMLHTRHLGH